MAGPMYKRGIKDYYGFLGVSKKATVAEIRKAYLEKAKVMHSDKGGNPEDFKFLSEAYQNLSDPDKRAVYDNNLSASPQASSGVAAYANPMQQASSSSSASSAVSLPGITDNPSEFAKNCVFYVYVGPDLLANGFMKTANKGKSSANYSHATSFEKDFPEGTHVRLDSIQYDSITKLFQVKIKKFKTMVHTNPTINYDITATALPLALTRVGYSKPSNIGLLAVSAGHKFAVFSHIEGVSNEFLTEAIKTEELRLVMMRPDEGLFEYQQHDHDNFITGENFQPGLSDEDIKIAREAIVDLNQRFLSRKEQIDSIEQALKNNSRSELQAALNKEKNPLRALGIFGDKKTPASSTSLAIEQEEAKSETKPIDHKP